MAVDASPTRAPLEPLQRWILWGWIGVAVGLMIWFASINRHAGDWADLVAVIVVVFFVAAVVAVGITYGVVRVLPAGPARTAVAAVGPPGLFLVASFVLWLL